jgi:hypothetical protein
MFVCVVKKGLCADFRNYEESEEIHRSYKIIRSDGGGGGVSSARFHDKGLLAGRSVRAQSVLMILC